MSTLSEIPHIGRNLKTYGAKEVKSLHKFIFESEGDRCNRKRLRNFEGFLFPIDSEEYINKQEYGMENLTAADLVAICGILGVDYNESKEVVLKNVCAGLIDFSLLSQTEDLSEDSEESDDDEISLNASKQSYEVVKERQKTTDRETHFNRQTRRNENLPSTSFGQEQIHFAMSFQDIKESVPTFDASENYPVDQWIRDFDDTAILFGWNEMQKLIYAKRSLSGIARLFVQSEGVVKSYYELKALLRQEFHKRVNSAHLHESLRNRKMKRDETVQEYFLTMRSLAHSGNIDDNALMTYVINGIRDDDRNKIVLYGATNIREFKDRLRIYESIHEHTSPEFKPKFQADNKKTYFKRGTTQKEREKKVEFKPSAPKVDIRCFNCGSLGHRSSECKNRSKGVKCFRCNNYGHKAIECDVRVVENNATQKTNISLISTKPTSNTRKLVLIESVEVEALIDTGSEITIVREDVYKKIGSPKLHETNMLLIGFGNSKTKPIGYFQAMIHIDDQEFLSNAYVVSHHPSKYKVIIGNDLLRHTEVIINREGISVRKIEQSEEEVNLMQIAVSEDLNELDVEPSVNEAFKDEVRNLVKRYKPCKTHTTNVEMKIAVKTEQPMFCRPRRLPFIERGIVDRQVEEWIDQKIVEPSSSEYSSQVVVVRKKDGTPRVCIDFRAMNKIIIKDRYPLPLIEDVLDRLKDARVFSTIDLRNGFFHVDVHPDSRHYTAFVTHHGQYQFLKVPFGLCNSPSVFQRFINTVFRQLMIEGVVLPYMDDIMIPSSDEAEGIERLKQVFEVASKYGLEINFGKSQFLKRRIEFLGHVVESGCLSPSVLKTKAVDKFPTPTNLKQVQSFLGLTGYFRKFIPFYSMIAKPLSDMLKNNKFEFGVKEINSFHQLKQLLSETPVLGIYDPNSETEVHTDASIDGYGAVLLQKSRTDNALHPIYYMSKKTTDAERKYSSYELEVLAVIEALRKFRIYLLGTPFKIVTDCSAFQKTMNKKDLATRVARWALLLEEFDYTIEHRSGSGMRHVDALSRSPIMTISAESVSLKIQAAQEEDSEIKTIKELLKSGSYDDYCDRNGIIYKFVEGREALVIPEAMQTEIIRTVHDKGHFACKRTENLLSQDFYIPGAKQKIEKYIANCVPCILVNRKSGKQEGYLHPLHKADVPLHTYHIDHLGPLESTNKNYKHIFTVIDAFTKFVWLYPVKTTTATEVIAKLNVQRTVFGNPTQIISDRGAAFTSEEFKTYCVGENITHILITTGLPRANGQIERLNRVIIPILAKLSLEDPSKWYKHVEKLQQVINSSFQRSIATTPFELLLGTKMNCKESITIKELLEAEFQAMYEESREKTRKEAKDQILKVQQENRRNYNLRRRVPHQYKLNELVAIKRTQFGPGLKLRPKYLGPYRVTKVKCNDTYNVLKEGNHDGPLCTSTCAEFMKRWIVV